MYEDDTADVRKYHYVYVSIYVGIGTRDKHHE